MTNKIEARIEKYLKERGILIDPTVVLEVYDWSLTKPEANLYFDAMMWLVSKGKREWGSSLPAITKQKCENVIEKYGNFFKLWSNLNKRLEPKEAAKISSRGYEWNAGQEKALKLLREWFNYPNAKQVFRLFGFAGTGKTSLAEEIAQLSKKTVFCAYTGQAAMILKKKGVEASTIHSLIYKPMQDKETGQVTYELRDATELGDIDLIVVDECSMVGPTEGQDLESLGIRILVLGDPMQLPPIEGEGYFVNPDIEPDAMLTELTRFALDSPIIRLSFEVRSGNKLKLGTYGETKIIRRRDLNTQLDSLVGHYVGLNQIIVGTNRTRSAINNKTREVLGFDPTGEQYLPVAGETLMCLKNQKEKNLVNGSQWTVMEVGEVYTMTCKYLVIDGEGRPKYVTSTWGHRDAPHVPGTPVTVQVVPMKVKSIDFPDWPEVKVDVPTSFFYGQADQLHWRQKSSCSEFDYAYGGTVHKLQGSQFKETMILDESWMFRDKEINHRYTAITRTIENSLIGI